MYQIISDVLKYIFVIAVYSFIFSVIKLIYLDISDTRRFAGASSDYLCYLKLVNLRSDFNFKIYESYGIREESIVGRSKKCDIYISDPFLSKQHARIFLFEGQYFVEDLSSTNGTFVNSKRVMKKPVRIKDGDKITFGTICFLFVDNVGLEEGESNV